MRITIKNETTEVLYLRGSFLEPHTSETVRELIFDSIDIHSNIGSCEIHTAEKGKREIKAFGKLNVKEVTEDTILITME